MIEFWNCFNTLRPRQYGRHFADDTFTRIYVNENVRIVIEISLKVVSKDPINNIPALVQIMAWRRPGDKPLSEPMMVCLPTHICVTRPQWVNTVRALCKYKHDVSCIVEITIATVNDVLSCACFSAFAPASGCRSLFVFVFVLFPLFLYICLFVCVIVSLFPSVSISPYVSRKWGDLYEVVPAMCYLLFQTQCIMESKAFNATSRFVCINSREKSNAPYLRFSARLQYLHC